MPRSRTADAQYNTPVKVAEVFCPRCGSETLHRSHREGFYERVVMKLVGVRPYRCESCNERFYSRKKMNEDS